MSPKLIAYLDQNYVSYLAKVRLGIPVYETVAVHYQRLHELLQGLSRRRVLACPASVFHRQESERDARLAPDIYALLSDLSRGLAFRPWPEVLQAQARRALDDYLGRPIAPPQRSEAFFPDSPDVPPALSCQDAAGQQALLQSIVRRVQAAAAAAPASEGAYAFFRACYLEPFLADVAAASPLRALYRHYRLHTQEAQELPGPFSPFWRFFLSDQFRRLPFIDIFVRVSEEMLHDVARRSRPGDLLDVAMAATVLPYCDILATDRYVKSLVTRLSLDRRYGCRVFGARSSDLAELVRTLQELS